MKVLDGGQVIKLPVGDVIVEDRLRFVHEAHIRNLMVMAEDTGLTTPINVRKTRDGYVLIDGAHRLEVAKRLGMADIAAIAFDCRADEARAMEASNNLGAARMTPLQTAVFFSSWRRTYYDLHPERRQGVFKGNQYKEKVLSAENALTTSLAHTFGRKPRQIYQIMAIGDKLTGEEVKALDGAELALTLDDLRVLTKITDDETRRAVVQEVVHGDQKKIAKALRKIKAEAGGVVVMNAKDAAFNALINAWRRAPLSVRKRFCLEAAGEIWEAQNKGAPLTSPDEAADV